MNCSSDSQYIRDVDFVFVTGVEGSGTTMLMRLLGFLEGSYCLHGRFSTLETSSQAREINRLTKILWEHPCCVEGSERKNLISRINSIGMPVDARRVILKRSYPFLDQNHYPVLSDIEKIGKNPIVIQVNRGFMDNVNSIIRRGFETSCDSAIDRVCEASKVLATQLVNVENNLYTVGYERLIDPLCKSSIIENLERILKLEKGELLKFRGFIKKPNEYGYIRM